MLVAPVAAVGLDVVGRDDLAGVEHDDGDVVVVGDGEDAFAGVVGADPEVVHAAGASEADVAVDVDAVVAQPVVPGVEGRRERLRGRAVGVARGGAV